MKPLIINAKEDTPKIVLDTDLDEFIISGRSLPEDAHDFYKPLFEWLLEYVKKPKPVTTFRFELEYYNTSSSKQLSKLFLILKEFPAKVRILWYYHHDDIDMLENGKRYAKLTGLDFTMISIPAVEDDSFEIVIN
ncbi:MAG TPA: DUF1987 domain-containing protein [Salinivirgaceae bacterium]|nr:DUF1987 domain-containing protein [Salinivirgaceae bacterium]